jgi:hypothetical protein
MIRKSTAIIPLTPCRGYIREDPRHIMIKDIEKMDIRTINGPNRYVNKHPPDHEGRQRLSPNTLLETLKPKTIDLTTRNLG